MDEQPLPSESRCPDCGAKPTDESIVKHRLSQLGYSHDDIFMQCSECKEEYTLGIPIGSDGEEDLYCDSCEDQLMRVHRVAVSDPKHDIALHLKCPDCYLFKIVGRERGSRGIALVGYDDITGNQDNAEPYGY